MTTVTTSDASVAAYPARSGPGALRRIVRPAWVGIAFLGLVTLLVTQFRPTFDVYSLNTIFLACLGAIALNVLMGTAGQDFGDYRRWLEAAGEEVVRGWGMPSAEVLAEADRLLPTQERKARELFRRFADLVTAA